MRHCIVPPHILREIAHNGSPAQRATALNTMASDTTMRTQRIVTQFLAPIAPPALRAPMIHRSIYDARNTQREPGLLVRAEGSPPSADLEVNEAYDGLGHTFDFYLKAYQRNSIDDRGLPLIATVHYDRNFDNAFWDGTEMVFGDGDGTVFNRFTIALDVIGHELTHGVTGSEANLLYSGQSGALNESVSDVFGSLIKQYALGQSVERADWLIGEGLLTFPGQALRSMKAPGTAYDNPLLGKDPQPANMKDYNHTAQDNGGVHINSGIPNHAFYLVATALGGYAWAVAGQIWYDTIGDRNLRRNASFAQFAGRTIANTKRRYGSRRELSVVVNAWAQVGVKPA